MKKIKLNLNFFVLLMACAGLLFINSCSGDDQNKAVSGNEAITDLQLTIAGSDYKINFDKQGNALIPSLPVGTRVDDRTTVKVKTINLLSGAVASVRSGEDLNLRNLKADIMVTTANGFKKDYALDFNVYENKKQSFFFSSVWKTDIKTSSLSASKTNQIKLPLVKNGTYNFTVYWGDGASDKIETYDSPFAIHTYNKPGTYRVFIRGKLIGWQFGSSDLNINYSYDVGDAEKLLKIKNWGMFDFGNTSRQFAGAENMVIEAINTPSFTGTVDFSYMFYNNKKLTVVPGINDWNTSKVTNMSSMFAHSSFNQYIGSWDVSEVRNMKDMFFGAPLFNRDISHWDTSKVTNTSYMFAAATLFNQNIGSWNVSMVTNMRSMFFGAFSFDQNIGNWDVSKVSNMINMFLHCPLSVKNYNALLKGWANLSKIKSLQHNVEFNALSQYSADYKQYRDILTGAPNNWTIRDGGQVSTKVQ